MSRRLMLSIVATVFGLSTVATAQYQPWNNAGLPTPNPQTAPAGPAPRRDLTGIWDAGGGGVSGPGHVGAPFTPLGLELLKAIKPGNGPRLAPVAEINDPLSTIGDPGGFPRNLLYELRPFQVVQTPSSVLILYMFEKRWRTIWTDGRALPRDPDPRWYGYSVGRWEDDTTLAVESVGMDERTWLDNAGNPHSADMRVEELYHRVDANTVELSVTIDDPKVYTARWTPRNKLPLKIMPSNVDLMEMINNPSDILAYRKYISSQTQAK